MNTHTWITYTADAIELVGVAIIALGLAGAVGRALVFARGMRITQLRQNMGRAILLGLEVLVAADIVRTVSDKPTAMSVATLAGIVAIRTFLSWTLTLELEGRWPWQAVERNALANRPTRDQPKIPKE
jgi:uncharacterized membrane protein